MALEYSFTLAIYHIIYDALYFASILCQRINRFLFLNFYSHQTSPSSLHIQAHLHTIARYSYDNKMFCIALCDYERAVSSSNDN